ncbi:MAG: cytochrome-c peroxidase [Desulfovibrio sp.]|jgi:cytochrome c peroxidase|nr:cytochrome-c peroxidase [Desulfovibrio sp.]
MLRKLVLFTIAGAASLYALRVPETALSAESPPPSMAKFQAVGELVRDKCMTCHTRDYALPFYSNIPGIRHVIEQDYKDGLRAMNLGDEFGETTLKKPVNESTLAKMEWVMINETMPPTKFALVHWGSTFSSQQRSLVLDWVKSSRAAHYATGTASAARSNEPVQPLPASLPVNPAKAALGQKLFNDKRLSGDNTVSCASCHALTKGGGDGQRFAEGVRKQFGDINAPTVFNAMCNIRQFWNGRAADLQEQAGGPPFNPVEMDSKNWEEVIAKLSGDAALAQEFLAVYPVARHGGGWSGNNITDAIAEYEKTLITPDSRFDKWLKGDDKAISGTELEGYRRFKVYRCSSCHVGKALGGQSFEYMDLKKDYFTDRKGPPLGSDEGLKSFTGKEQDLHKFKVPNLRNVELTAPYLHDGTATSLDETVRIMGTYLSGMEVPEHDRKLIAAFLRTLTGEFQGKRVEGEAVPF